MANYPQPLDKRTAQFIAQMERRLKRLEHLASDPVAIGPQLARTSFGSPGYTPGASGWVLNADGTGEVTGSVTVAAGGIHVTFANTPPASPHVGDLWYDGSNNYLLNQWNGSAWVPYTFGTNAITAGSIVTNLLAAGAVTAAKIAAGTIVAGIVDATTVHAPTLIGSTTLGYAAAVPRGPTLYDFESGTQGWTAAGGTIAQSTVWSYQGTNSLLLTASGAGSPIATSPIGTAGIAVIAGDPVYLEVRGYCPPAGGVNNFFCGIRWYDNTGTFISETDAADVVIPADTTVDISIADVAPAAGYVAVCFGNHGVITAGTLIYGDYVEVSGNLAFSFSAVNGTDGYGFLYEQGIEINSLPGLTSVLTVQDGFGDDIMSSLDSEGNFSGQIGTFSDIFLGGNSLLSTILPALPQGLIARTNIFANTLPTTATASEFYLYELDVDLIAGRDYLLMIEPIMCALSGAGRVVLAIYGTADGSQPSNASPVVIQSEVYNTGTANFGSTKTPPLYHPFSPSASATYRFLVSLKPFNTGGGAPTLSVVQMDNTPTGAVSDQINARFEVYDMGIGANVPNTGRVILATAGGTGGGLKNYTKTYTAQHTYSYQGSDGGNPNLKIGTDGKAYQGGDYGNTYNGKSKTWIVFPTSTIASDLSGATINSVSLYLNNNHAWAGSGMTACIGWDNKTSFGSTAGDPSGTGIDISESHFNQGQAKWIGVPNSIGTNYGNGNAKCLVLFRNSNNLAYYGFFSGGTSPQLKISYTK